MFVESLQSHQSSFHVDGTLILSHTHSCFSSVSSDDGDIVDAFLESLVTRFVEVDTMIDCTSFSSFAFVF